MATLTQGADTRQEPALYFIDPKGILDPVPSASDLQPYLPKKIGFDKAPGVFTHNTLHQLSSPVEVFAGQQVPQASFAEDWFETFHVVPRSFNFGNLLSAQSPLIEVFCSFRTLPQQEWASVVNNAGAGVSLGSQPSLPVSLGPLAGVEMTLDVSTSGPPFVDDTLDFAFTGIGTAFVNVIIQRIVLWGLRPERGYEEQLEFKTEVMESKDGSEKRYKLRKSPRQSWSYNYIAEEGTEAQTLENLLYDFQSRNYGVPVVEHESTLTAGVSIGDTVVTVDDTAYRDYRVAGFAIILTNQSTFDVLEIAAGGITSTTLTFVNPTTNAYLEGSAVFPLSIARLPSQVNGSRWINGLRSFDLTFMATNNDVDHSDLSAFSSYKSKLLLDNGNAASGLTISHGYRQDFTTIDGEIGLISQTSNWDRNKRSHQFTLRAEGRQAIWEMRQMIYAIAGRRKSFYIPTDSSDLELTSDLLSGSDLVNVKNVGYSQFVRQRQPKSDIRINFVDGSAPLLRAVIDSFAASLTVETLTVDSTFGSTIAVADVSRVEYVEKVRFDTDRIRIEYDLGGQVARMTVPVVAVFE